MEHLKANTRQKIHEERDMTAMEDMNQIPFSNKNFNSLRFSYNEYQEDELEKEENEKKKMSRMRRNDMKRTTTYLPTQPNRYFKEKKLCRNCKN